MRSITLAALATTALIGLTAVPAAALTTAGETVPAKGTTTTEKERGIVLECTGRSKGLSVYVNLYENDRYTNYVQVILNDDPELSNSREPEDFFEKGRIHTGVTIDGKRARIDGTAHRVSRKTAVHEEHADAGYDIVIDGFHRRLVNDLVLTYGQKTVQLDCDPAFAYNLTVSRTPQEGVED